MVISWYVPGTMYSMFHIPHFIHTHKHPSELTYEHTSAERMPMRNYTVPLCTSNLMGRMWVSASGHHYPNVSYIPKQFATTCSQQYLSLKSRSKQGPARPHWHYKFVSLGCLLTSISQMHCSSISLEEKCTGMRIVHRVIDRFVFLF